MKKGLKILGVMVSGFLIGMAVLSFFSVKKVSNSKIWVTKQDITFSEGVVIPKGTQLTQIDNSKDGAMLSLIVVVSPDKNELFDLKPGQSLGELPKNIVRIK